MKNILKKSLLILLLLFIAFPTTILTACKKDTKDTNVQAFYDYALTAKTTLDNLANETSDVFYTITYNPYDIDLEVFTNISLINLKKKRDAVQSDYDTLSELCDNTKESSLHFEVKTIFYAFEDYANCVFKMERPYSTFTSKKELYERELRDALLELERALSN
jgi:hypothetical protein